jgi:hypothetical protein
VAIDAGMSATFVEHVRRPRPYRQEIGRSLMVVIVTISQPFRY